MKKYKLILGIAICMFTSLLGLTACNNSEGNTKQQINLEDVATEYYLDNGYYTVGLDIPAGICSIYATYGTGSILYSQDGTINTYSEFDDDLNQFISNDAVEVEDIMDYTLKEGYTIHITGPVRTKVTFSKVTSGYTGREYDTVNKITLEPGKYIAGKDFEAGVYTITAVEGNGTLISSNAEELGINEMFGVYNGTEVYVAKSDHVTLNKGDSLESIDVAIEMVKVK